MDSHIVMKDVEVFMDKHSDREYHLGDVTPSRIGTVSLQSIEVQVVDGVAYAGLVYSGGLKRTVATDRFSIIGKLI